MILFWQCTALLSFGLWIGLLATLALLRQPNVQPQPVHRHTRPLHWIPTKQVTHVRQALEQRGFLVLNLGSVNGMTLVAKCEVTQC